MSHSQRPQDGPAAGALSKGPRDHGHAPIRSHARTKAEKNLFILKQLVSKDFKIKYRRSFLGVAWSVLNPLLMMIVMSIVFTGFLRFGNIPHAPVYIILGNVTFGFMQGATSDALGSILGAAPLLKKVKVDRWVFPMQKVLFALVNTAFSFIAVVIVMVFEQVPLTRYIYWMPICLILLMAFSAGVGLLLSAAAVFFRDVIHLWSVALTAWTYLTPLFWPMTILDTQPHWVSLLVRCNPMYGYVEMMRHALLYGSSPGLVLTAQCVIWAAGALIVGYWAFHRNEHKFILYI